MVAERKTTTGEKPVLLTGKLRPPMLHRVLVRERLMGLVTEEHQTRITIICGGPGYGKTTLMTHLTKAHPGPVVWYQIDGLDNDPAVFLRNIIQGVSQAVGDVAPTLGQRATARLEGAGNIKEEGESILGVLADEISEMVKEPLLLCLDDYHLLTDHSSANRLIGFLARQGPERLRLVLTSRLKPRLPLGRLRSQGKVVEIGEGELRFSLAELEELLSDTWKIDLPSGAIRQLYENTEGWAASFVLAENLLKRGETVPELFGGAAIRKNIYEYLVEEVLSRQPAGLRDFLMKSSLVDPVDPEICSQALAVNDAQNKLQAAEDNNLFTSRIEDTGLFRYHPLFREFLQEHLREAGEDLVRELHGKYAEVFEAAGKLENAIEHYFAAGAVQKATELLAEFGSDLISSGRFTTLEKWLEIMPEGEGPAAIDVYRGEILLLKGNVEDAKRVFEIARIDVKRDNQLEMLVRCSLSLAECFNILFLEREAIRMLRPILDMDIVAEQRLELLIKLGICLGLSHQFGEAEEVLRSAEILAKAEELPHAIYRVEDLGSFIATIKGDFASALRMNIEAVKISDSLFASQRSAIIDSLAFAYTLVGDYENAQIATNECLERVETQREKRLLPNVWDSIGAILVANGNFEEGVKYLKDAVSLYEEMDSAWSCGAVCHLGTSYRRSQQYIKAFEEHTRCVELGDKVSNAYARAIGIVNQGADLIHLEQFDYAEDLLDRATNIAKEKGFTYILTQAEYHKAWLGYLRADYRVTSELLTDSLERANQKEQNHFIIQESRLTLPLLAFALEKEIESDYIFWILERRGDDALSALEPLMSHANPVQRQKVAKAIGKIESSSSLSLLRKMTRDNDARVRLTAQSSIEGLRPRFRSPTDLLTTREEEVLRLIADGLSNGSIGQNLFISERTVKTHVSRIFQKLGMTNRLEAALYFKGLKNITFEE